MILVDEIQKLGLSDKEAKVYLATLELAQSSVQHIAQNSGINRSTAYVVLETLIKFGLVSTIIEGKKTLFIASSPESLEGIFEQQKKEIDERKENLNKILPDLHLIYNREKGKPTVRFFEGRSGLLNSVAEFYKTLDSSDDSARLIYNRDLLNKAFSEEERDKYRQIRLGKKVKTKSLYTYKEGELVNNADGVRKKVSGKDFPFDSDIAIYGDNIRISTLGKRLSSILIKDKGIAQTFKSLFDLAWQADQIKKKK